METNAIKTVDDFVEHLSSLHKSKKAHKITTTKRQALSSKERNAVLQKTDCRCHVCGIELTIKFHADHVKSHVSGGEHNVNNYLPSCEICNRCRWHYSSEEIQLILKLGLWAGSQIKANTKIGREMALSFLTHEKKIKDRRKIV